LMGVLYRCWKPNLTFRPIPMSVPGVGQLRLNAT